MELSELRKKIDDIDEQLIPLLIKRMELSTQVAQYKKENNLPIFHPAREKEILNNITLKSNKYGESCKSIYSTIFAISRQLQQKYLDENK